MSDIFKEHLQQVIDKLKNIYTLTNSDQCNLPLIVIIGARNSGKSSLIESLLGYSFLPIGPESVTKCPVEIKIVKKDKKDICDWVVFQNAPDCHITDFQHVKRQIEMESIRLGRDNDYGLSCKPISLAVNTDRILTVTFVDLPGLKKISVGDNPKEVEIEKAIMLNYISDNKSIILVVIPADKDVLSDDCLKLAKQVDPEGIRTIVVLTKLDIIEYQPNGEIHDILCGKVNPVRLDVIGVVKKSITSSVIEEISFLRKHYPQITHKHGISQLHAYIRQLIVHYFREFLPKLKDNIFASYRRYKQLLANFGEPVADCYRTMLEIVSNFSSAYSSTILGPYKDLQTVELTGGARINYIFREIFGRKIRQMKPLEGFNRTTLLTAIRNASGIKTTIFIPDKCFELLVKAEIRKLQGPSLRCVQLVFDELEKLIDNCSGPKINSQLRRFPKLRERIVTTIIELIKTRIDITNEMVNQLINIHTSYINTGHPDFILQTRNCYNGSSSFELYSPDYVNHTGEIVAFQGGDNIPNRNYEFISNECQIIDNLVVSYFNIVRTAVEDSVPKTIMHFLVNYTVENIQSELMAKLFSNGIPDIELMSESNETAEERKQLIVMIGNHEKAIIEMSDINEILK